jgi:hypothetical protein
MDQKVLNPVTNRWIKKNGALYKELVAKGVRFDTKNTRYRPAFVAPHVQVPNNFDTLPVDKSRTAWGLKKPDKIGQRRKVLKDCGKTCFLAPAQLKFPVCNKDTPPCEYNCRGIKAVTARAGEWKYKDVLSTARALAQRSGCYKT